MKAVLLVMMTLGAQDFADEKEYVKRMHEIDHSFSVLQKPVRRVSDVEKEAEKLALLFGQVEEYWKGRGDEDLAGFARMAKEGAEKAREAAGKNEEKALQASVDTIARSCEGCHREPLDKYRIPKR